MRRLSITGCLILMLTAGHAPGGVVHLRDGRPSQTWPIVTMDDAGVTVRLANGDLQVIPWDLVRDLEPDASDPQLAAKLEGARELWRARVRLQRNDPSLAEPIFERLFERYRGQSNECALIVAEGLLRCRLARGAQEMAVIPFLEMIRLRRAGLTTDRYDDLIVIYDPEFGLCPQLAPAWVNRETLEKVQRDLDAYDSPDDDVLRALVEAYHKSIQAALQGPAVLAEADWPQWPNHDGIDLLEDLLGTMAPEKDRRTSSRIRLLRRIPQVPPWTEAWIRHRVGMSLLTEPDEPSRQKGLVSLAHLPARFGRVTPYLTALGIARMARELEAEGRPEEAAILRAELERRFPGHPILFENEADVDRSDAQKENA